MVRYCETVLAAEGDALRLTDKAGHLLLELTDSEVDEAIRAGYVDPERLHYSMFEYYRIRLETSRAQIPGLADHSDTARAVDRFLDSLGLGRRDDKRPRTA